MSAPDPHLASLVELVAHLRGPDGCPWDREQGIEDIRGYLLEEAHEVAEAIDSGDWRRIREELGDLLFQVAFISQLARETSEFELDEVVESIRRKMIERHPHVFADEELTDSRAVHEAWERRKLRQNTTEDSLLDGLPTGLPALLAAYRMTQKAAGVGFDWTDTEAVLDKVEEEVAELRHEMEQRADPGNDFAIRAELGDLLFSIANLSRHLGQDPESVLAEANNKFRRRFAAMETAAKHTGRSIADLDLEALEELWTSVKRLETG